MRLDHISYVASHDQISDVVNRIGSQIGTAFVDGGIHPKFGTRNFTAPLLNGQYIEVVCPMDHPATETTEFGKIVKEKSLNGGGWLTWVISIDDMGKIEKQLKQQSVFGQRNLPSGKKIEWKQIGLQELAKNTGFPFFIKWLSNQHPSTEGTPTAKIHKIVVACNLENKHVLQNYLLKLNSKIIELEYTNSTETGILKIEFEVNNKLIKID
jgi:hypothetical protein